jgi:hypothetical protein
VNNPKHPNIFDGTLIALVIFANGKPLVSGRWHVLEYDVGLTDRKGIYASKDKNYAYSK